MKIQLNKLFFCVVIIASAVCSFACTVHAVPLMLNNVPTTDVTASDTLVLMLNYYGYRYKDAQAFPTQSMIYSLEYGYKKMELGFDYTADKGFIENGGYPGPMAWNFKYRILTEGSDPVSLAAGAFYLGSRAYNDQYYGTSPYLVMSRQFNDVRLHLGWQTNLLGVRTADEDNRKSSGILIGVDGTAIKHAKRPVSMFIDYVGGPLATFGIGVYQPLNTKWSWAYSFYRPVKRELPLSGAELADQHWFGISYSIPLGRHGGS